MNINVKFYMYFNGERIRTLDDLRENFIADDVLEAYSSGQLAKWLKVWRHKEELEQVEAIESESAREILRELVRIFDPEAEAEEIDAELSVYDYLEERKKFREHLMTHGLGELETLRRERDTLINERDTIRHERDTLQQENDRLKSELQGAQRRSSAPSQDSRGKRIDIPAGSVINTWLNFIPSHTNCRIRNIGNCKGQLFVNTKYNYPQPIEVACSDGMILQGISLLCLQDKTTENLYFYYEEV